jgi:DNA-binding GntR family transcriptional regulator
VIAGLQCGAAVDGDESEHEPIIYRSARDGKDYDRLVPRPALERSDIPDTSHRSDAIDASAPPTRAAWVDQLLRRAILSGELAPGEKLLGEHLAARWGVSPTPLRESFQRLAGEGLVVIEPQRGARVAPIDARVAAEIYDVRLLLDPSALRSSMAAGVSDPAFANSVRAAHRALEARHRSIVSFHDAHRAFHLALVGRCSNSLLLHQVTQLLDQSQRYRVVSVAAARAGDPIVEHRELVQLVAAGDTVAAVRVLTAHLRSTRDSIVRAVSAER